MQTHKECSDCTHLMCYDYYDEDANEWYMAVSCDRNHYDHVDYYAEACEDFEED